MKAFTDSAHGERLSDDKLKIVICVLLAIVTFSVYQQVSSHDFINFDDDIYITKNPRVAQGLTWDNVVWAFRTTYFGNWHPLTWVSYFIDAQLFGVNASAFLLVNVFIHIGTTLLLFLFLSKATACPWRSAFVAALFALHPLHVESVAWASERKDVLCAFFWMLTMGAYFSYARAPTYARYLRMLFCFLLGMMAKPMMVTLPFVLLLMDYWPLKRLSLTGLPEGIGRALMPLENQASASKAGFSKSAAALVKEKIPLFIIVAASGVVTFVVQQNSGAVAPLEIIPTGFRTANALVSYFSYLIRMFWPHNLSVFYPYPETIPWWKIASAVATLLTVSYLTIRYAPRYPYLLVGWLWYLGTLVPVIGFLQVGLQAMADRYTYIPMIGLFIMLVWFAFDMTASKPLRQMTMCLVATTSILVLVVLSTRQIGYWKNSFTIFKHALETTPASATTLNNYGLALIARGRLVEASELFRTAIRLEPQRAQSYVNLGLSFSEQGRLEKALLYFKEAHRLDPSDPIAVKNYKRTAKILDERLGTIAALEQQLPEEPENVALLIRIGTLYQNIYKLQRAITCFRTVLSIDAANVEARNALAAAYAMQGNYEEAEAQFKRALETQPKRSETYYLLAGLYGRQKRTALSMEWLRKAIKMGFKDWKYLRIDPNFRLLRQHPDFYKLINQSS